jgi:hypothetical protein
MSELNQFDMEMTKKSVSIWVAAQKYRILSTKVAMFLFCFVLFFLPGLRAWVGK